MADLLRCLAFDEEVLQWVSSALRESHADERRYHDEAILMQQRLVNELALTLDAGRSTARFSCAR